MTFSVELMEKLSVLDQTLQDLHGDNSIFTVLNTYDDAIENLERTTHSPDKDSPELRALDEGYVRQAALSVVMTLVKLRKHYPDLGHTLTIVGKEAQDEFQDWANARVDKKRDDPPIR